MGHFQGVGDLPRDTQHAIEWQSTAGPMRTRFGSEHLRERLALDELEDQQPDAVRFLEAVNRTHVGMIERREHPRLALETRQPIRTDS